MSADQKLQLREIRYYSDLEQGDDTVVRLVVDNKSVLLGDWYHDKISSQIKGFKQALDYLGIPYDILPQEQRLISNIRDVSTEVWE